MFHGFPIEKSIGELSEENDFQPFVDMLTKFILEVKKKDGSLYHLTKLIIPFLHSFKISFEYLFVSTVI
jgi:hypothetical protein